MLGWLRRTFITGFFVTVPLVVSVVAIVWVFRFADRLTGNLGDRLFGQPWPGIGIIVTALIVLAVGAVATNVFGQRLLRRSEDLLLHVPLFRTIYAPVKQLLSARRQGGEFGRQQPGEGGEHGGWVAGGRHIVGVGQGAVQDLVAAGGVNRPWWADQPVGEVLVR